jgi:hypothetical protein
MPHSLSDRLRTSPSLTRSMLPHERQAYPFLTHRTCADLFIAVPNSGDGARFARVAGDACANIDQPPHGYCNAAQ